MERVNYAINNLIAKNYFLDAKSKYFLHENRNEGKSELEVCISNDNLCVEDFDHAKKCSFFRQEKEYGLQKSVDHIIFEHSGDKWNLHMIEMKTSVGNETWKEIKRKVRSSFLSSIAIAAVLGIHLDKIYVYTTYENDKFEQGTNTTNPLNRIQWRNQMLLKNTFDFSIFLVKKSKNINILVTQNHFCVIITTN